jgi:hypothetical protein
MKAKTLSKKLFHKYPYFYVQYLCFGAINLIFLGSGEALSMDMVILDCNKFNSTMMWANSNFKINCIYQWASKENLPKIWTKFVQKPQR